MKITLKWDGDNGKEAFVVAEENDGWRDLRLTLSLDDCDKRHALKTMKEIMRRVNEANAK